MRDREIFFGYESMAQQIAIAMAESIQRQLRGNSERITGAPFATQARLGVSEPCLRATAVPKAYEQAVTTLEIGQKEQQVQAFGELSPFDILVTSAAQSLVGFSPQWADQVIDEDCRTKSVRTDTLIAYFNNQINASATSKQLGVHKNTVVNRQAITTTDRSRRCQRTQAACRRIYLTRH